MDDEYEPTHSDAFERFRRGEIDVETYLRETEEGLVDVLHELVRAQRELERREPSRNGERPS